MEREEAMKIIEQHCPSWPNCSKACDDCFNLSLLMEYGYTSFYRVVVNDKGEAFEDKDNRPLMPNINQMLAVDIESLMPFNDKMSLGECYDKGMYDLAVTVRNMTNKAKSDRQQNSYKYWGKILDDLICDLEHLTHDILIKKIQK